MTRRLWKTWRATGAPVVGTGARVAVMAVVNIAPDRRGAGKQGRVIGASGFPQAGEMAKA
jgi:hypothetical protein